MSPRTAWKTWSLPLCVTVSLGGGIACGQQLLSTPRGATPLVAPVTVVSESVVGEAEEPVLPGEQPADQLQPLRPLSEDKPENQPTEATPPAPITPQTTEAGDAPDRTEVVEERYGNGALKVSREVVQDEQGNYLNHGEWKMFSQRGNLIVEGQYYEDKRHGVWNRWYGAGELPLLRDKSIAGFEAPYISQGIFDSGDLHGAWLVYDAKQRKICDIRFLHGERDGTLTWYHANGQKQRQMTYEKGVLQGEVLQWSADGTLVGKDIYDQGRRLFTQTIYYGGDIKRYSGEFLDATLSLKTPDDWWNGRMAVYTKEGKSLKHGFYTSWHSNGQMQIKGNYQYGSPVGTFSWWHANGQKSLEGAYAEGKQDGEWCWWHDNGQRSIRGYYTGGNPSGKWQWWNKDGKVAQSGDFSDDKGQIVVMPMVPRAPQAELPMDRPMKR